jgi:acyl carrier protein
VKIRGFRIELGEIEAGIASHPRVRQAVVIVDGEGERRRLLACVVAQGGEAPEPADLRLHLAGRLPEYMIPTAWLAVPALPLTGNGKVDRKALLERSKALEPRTAGAAGYVAPRSTLERGIAEVWQEVLGVAKVGLQDNFFDLGGHSLLLVQVQVRLQERLGREVSMTDLLSYASVEALARFLSGDEAGQDTEAENAAAGQRAEVSKGRLQQLRRRSTGTDGSPHE